MQSLLIRHIKGMNKQWKGASRLEDSKMLKAPDNDHTVGHTPVGEQNNARSSQSVLGTAGLSDMTKLEIEFMSGQMITDTHILGLVFFFLQVWRKSLFHYFELSVLLNG